MNLVTFRRACLCLTFLTPLLLASCSSTDTSRMPDVLNAKNCSDCTYFDVHTWFFTPAPGADLSPLIQSLNGFSSSTQGDDLKGLWVIKPSHDAAVPELFRKIGRLELSIQASSVTGPWRAFCASETSPTGEVNVVVTPGPRRNNNQSEVVSLDFSASSRVEGNKALRYKIKNPQRILLHNGASILNIQQVTDGYVVLLIRADYPG